MANNIWSNYTEKTATPVDADEVMVRDSTDGKNKRLLFGTFWKWVAKKLNEATISELQTSNKTIVGALNQLNSDKLPYYFIETSLDRSEANDKKLLQPFTARKYMGSGCIHIKYVDGSANTFYYSNVDNYVMFDEISFYETTIIKLKYSNGVWTKYKLTLQQV